MNMGSVVIAGVRVRTVMDGNGRAVISGVQRWNGIKEFFGCAMFMPCKLFGSIRSIRSGSVHFCKLLRGGHRSQPGF